MKSIRTLTLLLVLFIEVPLCYGQTISQSNLSSGYSNTSNSEYTLSGLIGNATTGKMNNSTYYLNSGFEYVINVTTSLEKSLILPLIIELNQNYPNPFNPTTTLKYGLPETSEITLNIFDIMGRRVKTWSTPNQQPGWHEVIWDGKDMNGSVVSTGVYIYSLRAGSFVETKKMVFMK